MASPNYVKASVASAKLGVSIRVLRLWDSKGRIDAIRTRCSCCHRCARGGDIHVWMWVVVGGVRVREGVSEMKMKVDRQRERQRGKTDPHPHPSAHPPRHRDTETHRHPRTHPRKIHDRPTHTHTARCMTKWLDDGLEFTMIR